MTDFPSPIMPGAAPYFQRGGPTGVLCLHGFTASPHEVLWLAQHLAGAGHTVYAPRISGHGQSPETLARARWQDWLGSALDGLHLLRQGCDRVYVCGLSMGGVLSLLSSLHTEVNGVAALAAPMLLYPGLHPDRLRWLKLVRPYSDQSGTPEFEQYIRAQQAQRGEPVLGRVRYNRWPTAGVEQLMRLIDHTQARLHEVRAPLLLIYSEADETVAPASMQVIRERVASQQVEAVLLKRSGHILTQDVEMADVFARVAAFVAD